jgi:hypothetical protein
VFTRLSSTANLDKSDIFPDHVCNKSAFSEGFAHMAIQTNFNRFVEMYGDRITTKVEISDRGILWATETITAEVEDGKLQSFDVIAFRSGW